jgi:hypothetical protein
MRKKVEGKVFHTLEEVKEAFFPNRPLAELEARKKPDLSTRPINRKERRK